jgi:hypothetical protein
MAKLVDALGLGSNNHIVQVQVLFCVIFLFLCSFYLCLSVFMKSHFIAKFKSYPLATSQKKAEQPWNSLLKLSQARKRFYKNQGRFFPMELNRSVSKRIFWQMAIPIPLHLYQMKPMAPGHMRFVKNLVFNHPWSVFRSLFFGKMWMLNHPSLVPGMIWPTKSKKVLLAKMRAFKALCQLVGKARKRFIMKHFQKSSALSGSTQPMIWSFASSLDCLGPNFLLKCGYYPTLSPAIQSVSHSQWMLNGFLSSKRLNFVYVGDFFQMTPHTMKLPSLMFSNLFTLHSGKHLCSQKGQCFFKTKPVFWLSSFFMDPVKQISEKKSVKQFLRSRFSTFFY